MMYRTIEVALWDDERVRQLDPEGKLMFLYLITNRHSHFSGIYYLSVAEVARETGLKHKAVDTLWYTLCKLGLISVDRVSGVVWVKKMLDKQGRGKKNDVAAAAHLQNLHKCGLIGEFLKFYAHRQIPYAIPLPPISLQEQEQEQEQRTGSVPGTGTANPDTPSDEKPKPPKADPIPQPLDTDEFRKAWIDWRAHLKEKGHKPTSLAVTRQLAKCEKIGQRAAIAMIQHSIEHNWQSLFEADGATYGPGNSQRRPGGIIPATPSSSGYKKPTRVDA